MNSQTEDAALYQIAVKGKVEYDGAVHRVSVWLGNTKLFDVAQTYASELAARDMAGSLVRHYASLLKRHVEQITATLKPVKTLGSAP